MGLIAIIVKDLIIAFILLYIIGNIKEEWNYTIKGVKYNKIVKLYQIRYSPSINK